MSIFKLFKKNQTEEHKLNNLAKQRRAKNEQRRAEERERMQSPRADWKDKNKK